MYVDYRTLNKYIARINYPIIEDQINVLKHKSHFSVLDLKDGFYNIRVAQEEDSIKYTAFITPLDQFEYTKMPFGLKSAPGRFQKFVNQVLGELIRGT